MEAEAKHDFPSTEPEELAFKKGETLYISNYGDPVSWYTAHKGSKSGLVPGNYIEVKRENWYMGRIARSVAEQMLQNNQHVGVFLVRLSESSPSDFSLSVKCTDAVQHFRILKDQDNKYFLWSTRFDSINKLVEYYRHETVSKNSKIVLRDMNDDEIFIAEALYNFEPQETGDGETELGFKEGEKVVVFDTRDTNWWGGRIGDRTGFFPKTYVKRIPGPFMGQ